MAKQTKKANCNKLKKQSKQLEKKYKKAKKAKHKATKELDAELDIAIEKLLKKELKGVYKNYEKARKAKKKAKKAYKQSLQLLAPCIEKKKSKTRKKDPKNSKETQNADTLFPAPLLTATSTKEGHPESTEHLIITYNGKKYKYDDLKIVEGIGPKIAQLLQAASIDTWSKLFEVSAAEIREILLAESPRYRIHDPTTWGAQAELAATGKWEALQQLQEELKGGRIVKKE
ncbi:MAG: hypothetical protein AAF849_10050 [Bacteroidota bacterium]